MVDITTTKFFYIIPLIPGYPCCRSSHTPTLITELIQTLCQMSTSPVSLFALSSFPGRILLGFVSSSAPVCFDSHTSAYSNLRKLLFPEYPAQFFKTCHTYATRQYTLAGSKLHSHLGPIYSIKAKNLMTAVCLPQRLQTQGKSYPLLSEQIHAQNQIP